MRTALLFTLASTLLISKHAAAQDAVFVSGETKEISLVGGTDGTAGIEIIVRSIDHGVAYYSGEFDGPKSVVSFSSAAYDDAGVEIEIPITLRFDVDNIMVIADVPDTIPPSSDPSGTYLKLNEKQHLDFAKQGYKEVGDALGARWAELGKSATEAQMAELAERQKVWAEHAEYMSEWGAGDDFKSSPKYWDSLWDMTLSRLHFLDTILGIEVAPGIPGLYLDEFGGAINIVEAGEEGKFRFQINVVRGPTFHTGEITNAVAISDGSGQFVDTDPEAFVDGKPCTINFTFTGHQLLIKADNTAYYHGARAFFDGTYFKTTAEPEIVESAE